MDITLNTKFKSIHFENDLFEGNCVAVQTNTVLIENEIEDTLKCQGTFRLKKNNVTFEETFYLDRFFFYNDPCGRFYLIRNGLLHYFSCHER